jgi:hypothetical protein
MRFSRGKQTAARTPCHSRSRSMKRSDQRGGSSSSESYLAGSKHASNITTASRGHCVEQLELIDRSWHHMDDMKIPLPQLLQ